MQMEPQQHHERHHIAVVPVTGLAYHSLIQTLDYAVATSMSPIILINLMKLSRSESSLKSKASHVINTMLVLALGTFSVILMVVGRGRDSTVENSSSGNVQIEWARSLHKIE